MIQRIQSIFLLLSSIGFGLEFITPFASTDRATPGLFSDQVYNLSDHILLQSITAIGLLLCLISLFMYRKRKIQLRLGYVALVIAIMLPVAGIIIYTNQIENMQNVKVENYVGWYLPLGMILFIILAIRSIKKDEHLVKSMDRLR